MPLRLSPPVEQTFILEKTDQLYGTEGTSITVRQATQSQYERRQQLWSEMKSKVSDDPGIVEITQHFCLPELHRIEAYLTLIDCNIEDEEGHSLFRFKKDNHGHSYLAMNEVEFSRAWGLLPLDITSEIHAKILEVNPTWGNQGEA